jgi:hypothetical protein
LVSVPHLNSQEIRSVAAPSVGVLANSATVELKLHTGEQTMDWLEHVIDFGTPLVVLILLLRMLAQGAAWAAEHFVLPLRDRWLVHLKTLDDHLQQQTRMLCEILERVSA